MRGLIVRLTDEQQPGTMTVYVSHDIIRIERDGTTSVYEDSAHKVEQGLVQSARQQVPADIYTILVSATQ